MKALFISVAVAALAAFTACSSSEKADKQESTLASKIENCTNTDSLKAYVEDAKEYVAKLQSEGKVDEAKAFLDKIQPVVEQKAPALAGAFTAVQTSLDKISDSAAAQADSTKQAVTDSVNAKVEDAKDAVSDAVKNAKDAVSDKASEVADKSKEVVDKSKEAVTNAAEKTKDAASDAAKSAADKIKNL
ncbi:MAG: hypothetical protein HFJ94_07785 [Muribaculaceae bacterium]|nr:hypothetical protein [Muribaculaceae bacterium]